MHTIFQYSLFAGAFAALIIWIAKLVITQSFEAGIENYKINLQKLSQEHHIKFSKLHEDRASKIKILYEKVIELEYALNFSTTSFQGPEYSTDIQRDEECYILIRALQYQLDLDRIYFDNEILRKFDGIIKESWKISSDMHTSRSYSKAVDDLIQSGNQAPEIYLKKIELWPEAHKRVENEFKTLKEDLIGEFSKILNP